MILYVERSWHSDKGDQLIVDSSTKIDLKALLSAGIGAAERGGVEVKKVHDEHQLNAKSKGETREGANNPVTDGDMRSHKAIVHGLKKTFPSLKVRMHPLLVLVMVYRLSELVVVSLSMEVEIVE